MTINDRLDQGSVIIMDGGTGTEIQRRGTSMDADVWSGVAHMTDPDGVRDVHAGFIRAGAEIIIANTFSSSRVVLEGAGLEDRFEAVNRTAVEIAIQAREMAADAPVWVAGSISSMMPLSRIGEIATGERLEADYRRQAEVLAESGADLIVAEMMLSREGALPVVRAAGSVGLPVWVGFSASVTPAGDVIGYRPERYGDPRSPEDFGALVDSVLEEGCDVAGVMHSQVSDTGPALEALRNRWQGPLMAYAETGWFMPPNWVFEEAASPDEYAASMHGWVVDHGIQVVGGCCGTGPDHIRALRDRFA